MIVLTITYNLQLILLSQDYKGFKSAEINDLLLNVAISLTERIHVSGKNQCKFQQVFTVIRNFRLNNPFGYYYNYISELSRSYVMVHGTKSLQKLFR